MEIKKTEMASRLKEEFRQRTKSFAASVIRLYVAMPKQNEEVRVCGKQFLRSGTSVAAQVREASRARSDQEFVSKLGGALQDCDETKLWMELLNEECRMGSDDLSKLEKEAAELIAIMTTMINRTKNSPPKTSTPSNI